MRPFSHVQARQAELQRVERDAAGKLAGFASLKKVQGGVLQPNARNVNFVARRFISCSSPRPRHHCPCAENAAWELANMLSVRAGLHQAHVCDHAGLHAVHIPPVVLNPDCSLGLAEPDQQLPKDAEATAGYWEQPWQQQQQQQQQQEQRQAARLQEQRSQRTTLGRPSGSVELQQLPPTVLQPAPQQPGVCCCCWLPLECCQLPMRLSILHPAAGKCRSHLNAHTTCLASCLLLPPCPCRRPGLAGSYRVCAG